MILYAKIELLTKFLHPHPHPQAAALLFGEVFMHFLTNFPRNFVFFFHPHMPTLLNIACYRITFESEKWCMYLQAYSSLFTPAWTSILQVLVFLIILLSDSY
jgi:hypothetical protein